MAQAGYTPIVIYHSTTASAVPTAGNLAPGELALNINDMKLYCENSSGAVTLLASASGASGDVVGPASATDTAVALFDGTTGKLLKNSAVTVGTTGNTVISGTDNSNAMLRITQLGTGNALVVEDDTNPDATPFVVDASGNVGIGGLPISSTTSLTAWTDAASWSNAIFGKSVDAVNSASMVFRKSRGTRSVPTIVNDADLTGFIAFAAYDGSTYLTAANITSAVDGTPGTNDMPGRLTFSTTADGASSPTERMRIDSAGNVRIQVAATQDAVVIAGRAGGTSSYAVTLTPAELTGNRTFTLPEPGENVTIGYLNIPQNIESADYTLAATDAGKHIFHPSADTTARTFTIPANGSVPYAIGTAITFINQNGAGVVTISINTDTMRLAGAGTTGNRTLAANGIATAIKVTSTEWIISGTGLT